VTSIYSVADNGQEKEKVNQSMYLTACCITASLRKAARRTVRYIADAIRKSRATVFDLTLEVFLIVEARPPRRLCRLSRRTV
jgi:hypothetical protein